MRSGRALLIPSVGLFVLAAESRGIARAAPRESAAWPDGVLVTSEDAQRPPDAPPASFVALRTLGIRASHSRLRFEEKGDEAIGVQFATRHHSVLTKGLLAIRSIELGFIGGGSAGFEGGLGADVAIGLRAPVGPEHGPFARLGARGHLMGNDLFYSSILDLPVGQFGYQFLDGALFEVAATAAPVLVGRYNVEGAYPRALGRAFAWGGHVSARLNFAHLQVDLVRQEGASLGAFDRLWAELCGEITPLVLCADARYWYGDVVRRSEEVEAASTLFVGLHVGLAVPFGKAGGGNSNGATQPRLGSRPASMNRQ